MQEGNRNRTGVVGVAITDVLAPFAILILHITQKNSAKGRDPNHRGRERTATPMRCRSPYMLYRKEPDD